MRRLLLAVVVVMVVGCGGQGAALPTASPSRVVDDYGPPPAGVPLFYVQNSGNPAWFIGFDWLGKPRGTMKLQQAPPGGLDQAPDGSRFAYAINGKGIGIEAYLDRLGVPIADQDPTNYQSVMWADDSRQLCTLDFDNGQWRVGLKTPGAAPRVYAVAIPPSVVQSGIIGVSIEACSPANARVVLVRYYWGIQPNVWVVRLSDGTILSQRTLPAYQVADIWASPDGSLLAENSSTSSGYLGTGAANTVIRRTADGSVAATLDPTYDVIGFSSDDSVALAATSPIVEGRPTHLAVVRLADGAVKWRYDGPGEFAGRWIQPNGSAIAVDVKDPGTSKSFVVYVVHADGTATTINRLP